MGMLSVHTMHVSEIMSYSLGKSIEIQWTQVA